ncbi:hypothetical protein ES705_04991 [subsurface metagenome]|nr:MAG: hypothetical protein ES695_00440 [Candidatus Atribacteria bacterium 1244-E10-H5-B2]
MPKYLCSKCQGVFFGWAMKYKYKNKCPDCGSELEEVYSNNKTGNKRLRRDSLAKILKIRKNLIKGNL